MFVSSAEDTSELIPQEGMDEEYDKISAEINGIETELETKLKKFEKKLGCVLYYLMSCTHMCTVSNSSFGTV